MGWVQGVAGQQVMAVGARVRVSMISMCLGCDSSIARPVDWEGTTGAMVPYYLTTRYAMVPCYQRRVRGECRGSVAGWYLPTTTLLPRCGRGVTGVALRDPTRCVPCTLVMATATRHPPPTWHATCLAYPAVWLCCTCLLPLGCYGHHACHATPPHDPTSTHCCSGRQPTALRRVPW